MPGYGVTTGKHKGKQIAAQASSFFAPRGVTSSGSATGHQPLLLPITQITGLTRSQQLLSYATGLDPRSLRITMAEKDAFFLFMELRKKYQWATFSMTPRSYVQATSTYNIAVEKKNAAEGRSLVRKTPRALLEKLGEVEAIIIGRINRGDYKCKSPLISQYARSSANYWWQRNPPGLRSSGTSIVMLYHCGFRSPVTLRPGIKPPR